jgi:hypothetical protein
MAAQVLRGRVHDQIGAQLKRPLDQRRGQCAVDHHQGVRLAPCGADGAQVSDRQQRVGRRFQPQQVGVGGELKPTRRVFHADADHAPQALRGTGGGQTRDTLVAVVAEHHGGADRQQIKDRRDGSHARGKRDGLAGLQAAKQLLERLPGRCRDHTR